ncbi:hypothetical protein BG30_09605 [Bacillus subtilis subsp. subtilis]|nr:hypothetical protein BG30_09605 [Bacillus subtilis subsp. subtilis]
MYKCLDISKSFNNIGSTTISTYKNGDFSLGSSSFPREKIKFNEPIYFYSIPFKFFLNEMKDNIQMTGQKIPMNPIRNAKAIYFLGAANNGHMSGNVTLSYKEVITKKFTLYFTDFTSNVAVFNDLPALKFDYLHTRSGIYEAIKPTIWFNCVIFNDEINFDEIEFEDNPFIHIFAITIKYGAEKNKNTNL